MDYLFVYGTLKDPKIRKQLTGKYFNSSQGLLKKYLLNNIDIDGVIYPIIEYTGKDEDIVAGEYFVIDEVDLKKFDVYEGAEYRRIKVTLDNLLETWIYCK